MSDQSREARQYDTAHGYTALQGMLVDEQTSVLRKYQDVNVGSSGIWDLIKYELVTELLAPLPGALGLLLRRIFCKYLFGSVGKGVVIGRSVVIRHPKKIHVADGVLIDDYAVLDAKGNSNKGIFLGNRVMVGRNTILSCKDGDLYIGDKTNIAMNCVIQSGKRVTIGKNVLMAAYTYVIGGGEHKSDRTDIPIIEQGQIIRGIEIGDNVWLGAGVKVLDGVSIGRDVVIGSGAVVTGDIGDYKVAVGVPAKVIKDRREDKKAGSRENDLTR